MGFLQTTAMNKRISDQQSITQTEPTGSGFGVAASPFNTVKFELGVILCVGALLWLAVDSITAHVALQLIILFVYGLSGMLWLMVRTRQVVRSLQNGTSGNQPGSECGPQ
jgi:predicted membrane channel-forming protein YqfA (hemolysin III family)